MYVYIYIYIAFHIYIYCVSYIFVCYIYICIPLFICLFTSPRMEKYSSDSFQKYSSDWNLTPVAGSIFRPLSLTERIRKWVRRQDFEICFTWYPTDPYSPRRSNTFLRISRNWVQANNPHLNKSFGMNFLVKFRGSGRKIDPATGVTASEAVCYFRGFGRWVKLCR